MKFEFRMLFTQLNASEFLIIFLSTRKNPDQIARAQALFIQRTNAIWMDV